MSEMTRNTSKKEYTTPKIFIVELAKQDILTAPDGENRAVDSTRLRGSGAPKDLMESIFGPSQS